MHQHRVAAAVAVEDLLAGERDLDRPAEHERHLRRYDLVVERIALAAEAAAVRAGDDPHARRRQPQHLGQRPVEVVRRLGGRADGDAVVVLGHRHGRVLLHGEVGVPLVEERVLEDLVGRGEAAVQVAEGHRDRLVDVAVVAVVVNPRLGGIQSILRWTRSSRSGSYSTRTLKAASQAASSVTAATATTGSPTKRTLSGQSACSSCDTGRMPNGIGKSRPVRTAEDARNLLRLGEIDRLDQGVGDGASGPAAGRPCVET